MDPEALKLYRAALARLDKAIEAHRKNLLKPDTDIFFSEAISARDILALLIATHTR